jgi:hypothetical protein
MMSLVNDSVEPQVATTEHPLTQRLNRRSPASSGGGAERRRGLRISQVRPVKVYDGAAARYIGGNTADISATGLRLELPRWAPLLEGKTLNVHVGLSRNGQGLANRSQMIPARVVWVNRHPAGSPTSLQAGIEFTSTIAAHLDAA